MNGPPALLRVIRLIAKVVEWKERQKERRIARRIDQEAAQIVEREKEIMALIGH